jgi:hypothetical protein
MPISPTLRELLTQSIGAALPQNDDIKRIVEDATGCDPYNTYTNPTLPRAQQISQILEHLEKTGTERWLLTYVLVWAARDERLRQLIVKACPQTMDSSIPVESLVDAVIQTFEHAFARPLAREIRIELRVKRNDFDTVLHQNAELLFYKRLQELLLRLHTKLTFGISLDPLPDQHLDSPQESIKQILDACKQAREAAALLGPEAEEKTFEFRSIADLERLGGDATSAIERGDSTAALTAMVELQRLIRQHLSRLNGHIFELAKRLSLPALIDKPPISLLELFFPLEQPVRDLTPTVLARVLLRKMWQEALNEISLISDLLEAGLTGGEEFSEHWYTLKSRIRWLTTLEPDTPWSKALNEYAADIDTQLADEKTDDKIKPSFDNYRRAAALGFSAVLLKLDFGSLEKINPKLKAVLAEITHV